MPRCRPVPDRSPPARGRGAALRIKAGIDASSCNALCSRRLRGTNLIGSGSGATHRERPAMKPMTEAHFAILRRHMADVIAMHADLAGDEIGRAAFDARVMAAMREVPRHLFVPTPLALHAYQDMPLPIGFDK